MAALAPIELGHAIPDKGIRGGGMDGLFPEVQGMVRMPQRFLPQGQTAQHLRIVRREDDRPVK